MKPKRLFGSAPTIVAVDVANLAYRAYMAPHYHNLSTGDGRPSGHVFGTAQMLLSLAKKLGPSNLLWWFATEGRPQFRYELIPTYKSNREREGQELDPLPEAVDLVRTWPGGVVWNHPRLEADDVISRFVARREKRQRLVVVSNDHDLWQLMRYPRVDVWAGKALVRPEDLASKFGIKSPKCVALIKALFGDPSDCIKPCAPRLPRKPIKDLVVAHTLTTPFDLMEHLDELPARPRELLRAHEDQLTTNYKVVKLRVTSKVQPSAVDGPKGTRPLKRFLRRWECHSLIKTVDKLLGDG